MAAVDEIAIKLGLKTGDLKAALRDADVEIRKLKKSGEESNQGFLKSFARFKEGFEKFRQVLAGAGLVVLFKQLQDAAVAYAENYKGAFDENVAATLRLKESQQDFGSVIQKTIGWIGVGLVGAMEKFGIAVGAMVYGTDAAADALTAMEAENKKAFDDSKLKKFREESEKLAKIVRDNTVEQLSGNERINYLAGEYIKLLVEQGKLQKGTVEYVQKAIEVETKRGELNKAEAEQRKKEADELDKRTERTNAEKVANYEKLADLRAKERDDALELLALGERQKILRKEEAELVAMLNEEEVGTVGYNETLNRLIGVRGKLRSAEEEQMKRLVELAQLLMIPEEERTDVQKERIRLLKGETTEQQQQQEIIQLLNKGVENLTAEERKRLQTLTGQTAEMAKQNELALKAKAISGTVRQTGDVRNLSDAQLEALIGRVTQSLDMQKAADRLVGGVGTMIGTFKSIEQLMLQGNLDAAIRERETRKQFEDTVKFFGLAYAEKRYAPSDFDRLAQLFNPDQQKKDSANIAAIATGLQALFPDKFSGTIR